MTFPVNYRIGLGGTYQSLPPINLDMNIIDTVSAAAGSYHIHAMGEHFRDYVDSPFCPTLVPCPQFPVAYPYKAMDFKGRCAGVTGNLGEGVCGEIARQVFRMPLGSYAHLKLYPPRVQKTPDFIFQLGHYISGPIPRNQLPTNPVAPEWWPVESKAGFDPVELDGTIKTDAFAQLAAFWYSLKDIEPSAVGFGMAVGFECGDPPCVNLTVLTPANQIHLLSKLNRYTQYIDFLNALRVHRLTVLGEINACLC